MDNNNVFYRAELLSIDAWGDGEGGWDWNASYKLEDELFFHTSQLTTRRILYHLRGMGYLTAASKGKVTVIHEWPLIEIQNRKTGEPLLAFLFEENEYAAKE